MAKKAPLLTRARAALARAIAPKAQQRTAYAASFASRLTSDWIFASTRSPNAEQRYELRTMRNRARELVRNSPFGARVFQLYAENIVGPHGIRLQAKNATLEGGLHKKANAAIEAAWYEWSRAEHCDAAKKLSFNELLALAVSNWPNDGEIIIRFLRGPRFGPFGFALQLIDPDLLDETLNQARTASTNAIAQGVELDEWGAPVAYHIWNRYQDEGYQNAPDRYRMRVPASDIVHTFLPTRPGQCRGVPHGVSVLPTIKMLDGYIEAEIVAARAGSAKMGAIEDADPQNPMVRDPNAGATDIPVEMDPGSLWDLRGTGGKLSMLDPQHPTTGFAEFSRMMAHYVAVGFGISYGSLTGDLSQANYSSMRAGMLPERDHWKRLQQFVICQVLDPIYREWIKAALLNGQIKGVDGYESARWMKVKWQPRGFPWVDPQKDVLAKLTEVDAGVSTLTEVAAEDGKDFEEVLEQRKQELELLAESGVPSVTPGTKAPPPSPDGDPKDDTDTDDDEDKKPVRALRSA